MKEWLKVIADFDAFCSMANYDFNHNVTYPQYNEKIVLEAENLGHPLIKPGKNVLNDILVRKRGNIMIITGANMAGKSTFLRAAGVNLIFAQSGLPVMASKFLFSISDIYSSMRTTDSLNKNESYFYAELKRLKEIIEEVKKGKPVLIFLDEI